MLEAIKNKKLDDLGISLADEILEIGVKDDLADQMSADYIKEIERAKRDKNSVIYKSCLIKQAYKSSNIHKQINRLINKAEILRQIINNQKFDLKMAVTDGNKEIEAELLNSVAKKQAERIKLEKQVSTLMDSANKLQLAS